MKDLMVFRVKIFMVIVLVTIMGFGSKFYNGVGYQWFNNSLAGLFYDTFWCLVIFLLNPRLKAFRIGFWVFILTGMLEFLQLWHAGFLQTIRSSFLGSALIGNSFNWMDFPYNLAGCISGVFMIRILLKNYQKNSEEIN